MTHVLYILVRQDMASLTPGRTDAQTSHATSDFHGIVRRDADYDRWAGGDSFGTVIVKAASALQITTALASLGPQAIQCGATWDKAYGLRDGDTTHYISVMTCAWIFGDPNTLRPYIGALPLLGSTPSSAR